MLKLEKLPWEAYLFSEQEYADRAFLKPNEEILREYMYKRKRVRIRMFKHRYVDGKMLQFTPDHMIYIEFDRVTLEYSKYYIPYNEIRSVQVLHSKQELLMMVNKFGPLMAKIGPDAPEVMAEIEQRRASA